MKEVYWAWRRLDQEGALAWARQQLAAPLDAINLLRVFASESTSQTIGSHYVRKHGRLNLTELEDVASLEKWRETLTEAEKLSPKGLNLANIELFKRAERRRAKGLPDGDWSTRGDFMENDE